MNERNAIGTGGGAGSGSVARRGAAANDAVEIWKGLDPSEQDGARKDRMMQLWCQAEVNRLTNRRAGENAEGRQPRPRDDDRQAGVLRAQQAAVRVLRRPDGRRRTDRLRLHLPPPRRPRRLRHDARHPLLVPAGAGELDRGWHVGDPAQHHRRAGARPARRAPRRQGRSPGTTFPATDAFATSENPQIRRVGSSPSGSQGSIRFAGPKMSSAPSSVRSTRCRRCRR